MSALTEELSKKTIAAWRNFAGTPEFMQGIDHLRHNHAPRCGAAGRYSQSRGDAKSDVDLVRSAIGWDSYQQALKDVEDVLTYIPKVEKPIEEPAMNE